MEKLSRRQSIQLSATAVAAMSLGALRPSPAKAQTPAPAAQPDSLVKTNLRNIASLPLNPDGSAPEHSEGDIRMLDGIFWKTKGTPDIEFDYNKMKVKVDARGTANLAGTLRFSDLENLPRH